MLTGTKEEGVSCDIQAKTIEDGSVGNSNHECRRNSGRKRGRARENIQKVSKRPLRKNRYDINLTETSARSSSLRYPTHRHYRLPPRLERSSRGCCAVYVPPLVDLATVRSRSRPVGFSAADIVVHPTAYR
jgi:hypothetical protein